MINTIMYDTGNVDVKTAWGSLYASATQSIGTYATAFKSLFSVNVTSENKSANAWIMCIDNGTTSTAPTVQFVRPTSITLQQRLYVTAIGTWK